MTPPPPPPVPQGAHHFDRPYFKLPQTPQKQLQGDTHQAGLCPLHLRSVAKELNTF